MSSLEDEIRTALHAEGDRLRPIRPLRLPPPDARQRARVGSVRASWRTWPADRRGGWLVPALAAAIVVLIAISLVAVKTINGGTAPRPAPTPPVAVAAGTPRYYVSLTGVTDVGEGTTLVVGDADTGTRLATIPAPKGAVFVGTTPAAAGDDRTFIVGEASQEPKSHPPVATTSPFGWYLLTITPGALPPVQMTRLPIQVPAAVGAVGGTGESGDMALSADGTRLAVLFSRSMTEKGAHARTSVTVGQQALLVYSVASGQLLHAWYGTIGPFGDNSRQVEDLSWVGDSTVAFAVTWDLYAHTEVRTLDTTAAGTGLLADSHVVWSRYAPPPPNGITTPSTPLPCAYPVLAASGQAVVCAYSSYPPGGRHPALAWVEYRLSQPGTPRLLGSVPLPSGADPGDFATLEWVSATGSEAIGMWATMTAGPVKNGHASAVWNDHVGVADGGTVRPLDTGSFTPTGYEAW